MHEKYNRKRQSNETSVAKETQEVRANFADNIKKKNFKISNTDKAIVNRATVKFNRNLKEALDKDAQKIKGAHEIEPIPPGWLATYKKEARDGIAKVISTYLNELDAPFKIANEGKPPQLTLSLSEDAQNVRKELEKKVGNGKEGVEH